MCQCVCVCHLQLLPGVRQVVYLEVEVRWQLGGAPPQGLGAAQQADLTTLHHHQLSVAALETHTQQVSTHTAHSSRKPRLLSLSFTLTPTD